MERKVRRFEERLRELADEGRLHVQEPPSRYEEIPFAVNPEDLPSPATEYSRTDFSRLPLWEQLLYEGIMDALGYTKNQQPFVKLARNVKLRYLKEHVFPRHRQETPMALEAMMFGVAGLLDPHRAESDEESIRHVRRLRSLWRTFQREYHGEIANEADWQFFRLRPENFPTVRLAGASLLIPKLLQTDFFKYIIRTIKNEALTHREQYTALQSLLIVPAEGFWSNHFRIGEKAKMSIKTLIGKNRADEIILNAVVPVALLYARVFKDKAVRKRTLKLYEQCAPLGKNSITTIMEDQLVREKFPLDSALLQQGALQLYKYYCVEERCAECAVGRVVFR